MSAASEDSRSADRTARHGHPPLPPSGWSLRYSSGSAGSFHDLSPSPRPNPVSTGPSESVKTHSELHDHQVWVHQVDRTAVVLGSTQRLRPRAADDDGDEIIQPPALVDHRGRPVELCIRRSGGGLVVVDPDNTVWIDVIVPAWSPLHHSDVAKSFLWLGRHWVSVLQAVLEQADPDVDKGGSGSAAIKIELAAPNLDRRRSPRPFFCFDAIGHGEVVVSDRKVVGISQRRTRHWSRLQSLVVLKWHGSAINDLIEPLTGRPGLERLGDPPYDATAVTAGLGGDVPIPDRADLLRRFLADLPTIE